MRERDEFRPRAEQGGVGIEHHLATIIDRRDADDGAGLLGHHLPGDDVGVVLEFREHDLVARREQRTAGLGYEVDPLGRAPHEDDLVGTRRPQKCLHYSTGVLVGIGRPRRERMGTAMDVGIVVRVEVRDRVDDVLRLLRCRGIVEPSQRLVMHPLVEHREITTHRVDVEKPEARVAGGGGSIEPWRLCREGIAAADAGHKGF